MRILVVTDNRFWRNELGSQRRISSLCDYFVECGHSIEVLFTGYLYPPDRDLFRLKPLKYPLMTCGFRESLEETDGVFARILNLLRLGRNLLRQFGIKTDRRLKLRHPNDRQVFRNFLLQMREPKLTDFEQTDTTGRFREVCERFVPEVVLVEYVRLAWILERCAGALPRGCLKLIDTHDVQYERQSRFHRQGEIHEIDISPAEEARALQLGDVVLAIQKTDAEKLRSLVPGKEVIVVGYPSPLYVHGPRSVGSVRIGFFGSSMLPNRHAAEKLIHRHFPPLRARFGTGVELQIFGGVCAELNQTWAGAGVTLQGFTDDLFAAYDGLDIIANPVDFGGGLKIKTVEALCHGRPLVTTAIGAEGLEHGAGSAFWLATDEEDFTRKLDQLIGDAELRSSLGKDAMKFAAEYLGKDTAFNALGEVLAQASQRADTLSASAESLNPLRARWVVPVVNPRRAGLRYRCLYPLQELLGQGRAVGIWQDGEAIDPSLTLVFDAWTVFPTISSSSVAERVVALAEAAKLKGARIVVDNCDNQFSSAAESTEWKHGLDLLRRLARTADVFVTSSQALSDAMQAHLETSAQFRVVDDPIEESIIYPGDRFLNSLLSPRRKLAWMRLLLLRVNLAADQIVGRAPLVWFGSHGNQFSPGGMADILPLRPVLERIAESHPISLTIISNQRKKFDDYFQRWRIPTRYLEWDRVTFLSALRMHEISVIPSVDNAFTRCKSSNRLTLSIHHGLSVVADPIPSYQAYADVAKIGDWENSLRSLLMDVRGRKVDLARCQNFVRQRNSLAHIAAQWDSLMFPSLVITPSLPSEISRFGHEK